MRARTSTATPTVAAALAIWAGGAAIERHTGWPRRIIMSGRARTLAVRLALPALFLAPLSAAWAQGGRRHGPMWDGWGWGNFVFGPLMIILFIATIVVVVVLIVRWLGGPGGGGATPTRAARDALDDRYARGENDREEYLEKKKDLS